MLGNVCGHAEAEGEANGEAEVSSAEEEAEGEAGKSRVVVGVRQLGMPTSEVANVSVSSEVPVVTPQEASSWPAAAAPS
ncbi:unnamed protein product [Closterium sp. NIES-53]